MGVAEQKYKQNAEKGMDLLFPVSIDGKKDRPDIGICYHSSIKLFDPHKDSINKVHTVASALKLIPPSPSEVKIEASTLKNKEGHTVHVINLIGPHSERIKEHNEKFKNFGPTQDYSFLPHITVDKETWDKIKSSGAKTAEEARIRFSQAELRQGNEIISRYR